MGSGVKSGEQKLRGQGHYGPGETKAEEMVPEHQETGQTHPFVLLLLILVLGYHHDIYKYHPFHLALYILVSKFNFF